MKNTLYDALSEKLPVHCILPNKQIRYTRKLSEKEKKIEQDILFEYPEDVLSSQEKRIVILIASGLSNKEIASLLNVRVNTVKNHLTHIYQKLNIPNRVLLARCAYLSNLVPLDDSNTASK